MIGVLESVCCSDWFCVRVQIGVGQKRLALLDLDHIGN